MQIHHYKTKNSGAGDEGNCWLTNKSFAEIAEGLSLTFSRKEREPDVCLALFSVSERAGGEVIRSFVNW